MGDFDDIAGGLFKVGAKAFKKSKKQYKKSQKKGKGKKKGSFPCPQCGGKMKLKKGMYKCKSCGYKAPQQAYYQQYPPQQGGYPPQQRVAPPPQQSMPPPPPGQAYPPPGAGAPVPGPPQAAPGGVKPELDIDIVAEEDIHINNWDEFVLVVVNKSNMDIMDVDLKFKGPLEIHGHPRIPLLRAGQTERMKIGLKANELGRIPITIVATFENLHKKKFSHQNMDWINVIEMPKGPETQQVINIGKIDHSTNISDSVMNRSTVGGGGGGGEGSGTTRIRESVVQRSDVGSGGDDVEIDDSIVSKSNVGRRGNAACPHCGGKIKPGWKACPNCGNML
jgi:ribosomal protein L37AE/L43A